MVYVAFLLLLVAGCMRRRGRRMFLSRLPRDRPFFNRFTASPRIEGFAIP